MPNFIPMKIIVALLFILCLVEVNAQQAELVLPIGHSAFVHSAEVSVDGKHVVTGATDGTAKVWDVWGHLLFTLSCDEANKEVYAKYSPDGKQILTRSLNGVRLWEAATGTGIKIDDSYNPLVAAFSPSGKYFLVMNDRFGKFDLTIYTREGKYVTQPLRDTKEIIAAQFHPSDSLVVAAQSDQSVYVLNIHTGLIEHNWETKAGKITAMDISPDGKRIAIAADKTVTVYDIATGIQQLALPAHEYPIKQVLFADGGTKLITSPEYDAVVVWDISTVKPVKHFTAVDGTVTLNNNATAFITQSNWEVNVWDLRTGKTITTLDIESHTGPIYSMGSVNLLSAVFSPGDKFIVTASADQSAKLWDFPTGEMISSLHNNVPQLTGYATHKATNQLFTAYTDGTIKIWDLLTGKLVQNIQAHDKWILDILLSSDGKRLFSASRDATTRVWDAVTGKLITTVSSDPYFPRIAIANNGKNLVTTVEKSAMYWNALNGKLLRQFPNHREHIGAANISPDGGVLVTVTGADSLVYMWNVADGKLLSKFRNTASYWDPGISSDGKKLAMFTTNSLVTIRDVRTGAATRKIPLKGDNTFLSALAFTGDGKRLLIGTEFDGFHLADVSTGQIMFTAGDDEHIRSIHLSNTDSLIVLTTTDGSVLLFNAFTGKKIASYEGLDAGIWQAEMLPGGSFITVNNEGYKKYASADGRYLYHSFPVGASDFLCRSFSGFYYASPGAANLLHYKKGQDIISFQQLDLKYNRPDKVLSDINFADTALTRSYARAYHKRLSRLGLDSNTMKADASLPVAEIIGGTGIDFTRKEKELPLQIRCSDAYGLKRFNIWINDVPLYGAAGLDVSASGNVLDTVINIRLSVGRNYIETSVTNIANAESYRQPLVVQYMPATPVKSKLYFIGIGINKYQQSQYNLQWSVKDIRDLAVQLKAKSGAASIYVDTLFDEAVTLQNILQLKKKLLSATEEDKVVIAFSGHGLLSKEFDYFLSTYDVHFENPAVGGLPYEMLEGLLDGIVPRNKLMLIDACHSGEVDKSELAAMGKMADSLKLLKGFTIVSYKNQQSLGLKNSFELMQELFTNVHRSTGTTVISAAAGTQFALERGDLQNGVFTFSILEAMQNHPHITINDLRKLVTARVQEITNGMQKPTSRTQNYRVNWQLW
jgi:WD40 repeat protein